jgi:hypothetical protein
MSGGYLRMSDAKPRRQAELFNYPFPSQIHMVKMHSFYTQNKEAVAYQCICEHDATKLPSVMCTTVWVANTSKTEMDRKKTIHGIQFWATYIEIPSQFTPDNGPPQCCPPMPSLRFNQYYHLIISLQADVPKRKLPARLNGHNAMQMY